jgi:hypothetical protein
MKETELVAGSPAGSRPTRRRVLSASLAVGLASMAVTVVPARATPRTVECLADLGLF